LDQLKIYWFDLSRKYASTKITLLRHRSDTI